MRDARLKIRGSFFGKHVLVQARHGRVDFLHHAAEITDQRTAFASEIVDAGLARAVEVGVWLQKGFRHARWHGDTDKAIAKQTGNPNGEFASLRNLHVIINLERNGDPVAFANDTRSARNFADTRAREQNIRAFQQSAGIAETDGEGVVSFETLPQSAELHHERAEHRQPGENKNADLKFQTSLVPVHFEFLLSILALLWRRLCQPPK